MRQCGTCTLCCKLMPVEEIDKKANTRCKHQTFAKGCKVYSTPSMPSSCKMWNCRWIVSDDTADLPRPDRAHYVIDMVPDFITVGQHDANTRVDVVVVWVDRAFPDAHRDPNLRAYLARRGEEGYAALIRYNSSEGFVLFPPTMTPDGQFHESRNMPNCNASVGPQHSMTEILFG